MSVIRCIRCGSENLLKTNPFTERYCEKCFETLKTEKGKKDNA